MAHTGNKNECSCDDVKLSRRNLFALAGWGGLLATTALSVGASLRFMFPNVVYEPSPVVKVGSLTDYAEGTITFIESQRIFILRSKKGLRVLSAICKHLACTVNWSEEKNRYECPCHGSIYDTDGAVVSGPAPKPLDWLGVNVSPTKMLIVDKSKYISKDDYLKV